MKVLELFAGSRSIGKAAESFGHQVFSCDLEPFENIDYIGDILDFDVNKVPFIPDMIWASPPCTFFSVASIGHHWNKDHTPKTEQAELGMRIAKKTLEIIEHFRIVNPDLVYFIENPRGKLRKLDFMLHMDRATVWYCQYGDDRAKPTDIWTNHLSSLLNPDGWTPRPLCFNGNKDCHHQPAPRGSKTGTQGITGSYDRSKIPTQLCVEIVNSVKG
jgi:site-specific DNA-cytosine methylase